MLPNFWIAAGVESISKSGDDMPQFTLEALQSEPAKTVIPVYYETGLKTKYSRDEESSQMVDLIFGNRIYDLGNTYWAMLLRGGIFEDMFQKNDRNLASRLERVEPKINAEIDKVINAIERR